jgi:RNA recognition motif-containing protein
MQARLFIGNLSWNTTDADLQEFVAANADVLDAKVITDRDTGRSRGFGFVTIESESVQDVIRALDGQQLDGRAVRVNEAEERPQRDRGGYRGGGGGGGRDRY